MSVLLHRWCDDQMVGLGMDWTVTIGIIFSLFLVFGLSACCHHTASVFPSSMLLVLAVLSVFVLVHGLGDCNHSPHDEA